MLKECGWHQTDKGWWLNADESNGGDAEPPEIDLEFMFQAEKRLSFEESAKYEEYLDVVVNQDSLNGTTDFIYPVWHASAKQRMEAFLQARELWKYND